MPNTAVDVEGLSICELCTTSTMVGDGSWFAGSICGWLCWVGCTKAVACVCCWTVKMGWERDVWTLGLVERTEPLALPKTGTCSTGPSDCIAEKQTAAGSRAFISPSSFTVAQRPQLADSLFLWTELTLSEPISSSEITNYCNRGGHKSTILMEMMLKLFEVLSN